MSELPYILRVLAPNRAEKFADAIENERERLNISVSTQDVAVGSVEAVFVGLQEGHIDYVARASAGSRTGTFERRLGLSNFVPVKIGISSWCDRMPVSMRDRLRSLLDNGGRFTPALWREAKEVLIKLRPRSAKVFEQHQRKSEESAVDVGDDESLELPVLEREALATALDWWGGSTARNNALIRAEPIRERAPFLQNLGAVSLRENSAIEYDAAQVPGFEALKPYLVGAREFVDPSGRSQLTVLNANLKKLEEVLGVDLIYYNHVFRSFVLIQYKKMNGVLKNRPCYRPASDDNFDAECERMQKFVESFRGLSGGAEHQDVRLGASPFYFKFCDLSEVSAVDTGLSPGFYLPYRLVRCLLQSDASLGPRGGRAITWDTAGRFLSNKRMLDLIRGGWVGSGGEITERLEEVIHATLKGKNSLIYAITSPPRRQPLIRRDLLGRYTTKGDPEGHEELQ